MLGLLAIIMLLAGYAGYIPRFVMTYRKRHDGVAQFYYIPLIIALIMLLLLHDMGIPFILALALAIVAFLTLLERMNDMPLHGSARFFRPQYQTQPPPPSSPPMSDEEARAILNVSKTASIKEIKAAYHTLIIKNHPDHGGSSYLAAKINQARDRLVSSHP